MKASLVGFVNSQEIERACILKSVTLTPSAGVDATLSIFDGKVITGSTPLVIRASGNATIQISLGDGIPYPMGFTADPANADCFVIEYETS